MDENVVYDPTKSDGAAQPPPNDPNQQPENAQDVPQDPAADPNAPVDPTVDPNADPNAEVPVDPNADPNAEVVDPNAVPAEGEVAADGTETEEEAEEPPPPGGIMGFIGNPLVKKILIGLGILILLITAVSFFLPKGESTKQVKLQWWGLWEESNAVQTLIIDFKKTHPNIDVEYVKKDPKEYRERLLARVDNSTGPDVFRYHNTWMPMLSDVLLPLSSDVITPEEFKKVYYPVMQEDLVKNGAIYGIPMMGDTLAMYVNPKIFEDAGEQVPTNWDDFVKVSKKLTKRDSKGKITTAGAALGTYDNITHAPDIISLLFVQQGVNMQDFTTQQDAQTGALDYYTSFANGQDAVWDASLDNSTLSFSKGNVAIYFGFSWDVFTIQKLNKSLNFKVYPVPELYGKKTTIASYWAEGVSAKSPNQKEALEFMKYLSQKETAEKFYAETAKTRAFGEPYARKDLKESLREEPLVYPFVDQLDNAKSSFFASDTHDGDTGLNTMANSYLGTAIRSMADGGSGDSVVEPLNSGILQIYEKYNAQL